MCMFTLRVATKYFDLIPTVYISDFRAYLSEMLEFSKQTRKMFRV